MRDRSLLPLLAGVAALASCGSSPSTDGSEAVNVNPGGGDTAAASANVGRDAAPGIPGDTEERVKKIVVEHLGVDPGRVTGEARFIDQLGADSLDLVELVMAFEEEFGVEIPDDAAEKMTRVSDAVAYIEANKA